MAPDGDAVTRAAALLWVTLAGVTMAYFAIGQPDREPSRLAMTILAPILICEAATRPISRLAERLLLARPKDPKSAN